jgi:hypothetical protein
LHPRVLLLIGVLSVGWKRRRHFSSRLGYTDSILRCAPGTKARDISRAAANMKAWHGSAGSEGRKRARPGGTARSWPDG